MKKIELTTKYIKQIKIEHDNRCVICLQKECTNLSLKIYHIDGNSDNNYPYNLVPLCLDCNIVAASNPKEWQCLFNQFLLKKYESKYKINVMISTKDRHSETAVLLDSLRKQTFKNWNLILLDDASGVPINTHYTTMTILSRIRYERHYIRLVRQNISSGVCSARQKLIDEGRIFKDANLSLRLDDDVILEPDYIFKLLHVIDAGYDSASGVVPLIMMPEVKRNTKFVKPIINELKYNEFGDIYVFGDDCGASYLTEEIIPTQHFRTNLLYKSEINDKIFYEKGLSPVGFREETFFSTRLALARYSMAVHTGAICYHLQTPSGGCRYPNYGQLTKEDDNTFRMWFKKRYQTNGDPFKRLKEDL